MSTTSETISRPPGRITSYQWLVFAIATAGWVFDVYEGQLFTVFKTPALAELLGHPPGPAGLDPDTAADVDRQANLAFAIFLLGGAAGGLIFGVLGDRWGRVRVMSLTILTYSVFSALTYFVQELWQLHLLRFLVALGVGGEWAVGAALVAETFAGRARAFASGTFHAASVLGVGLASWTGMVLNDPAQWRVAFLIGLAPALLTLWIRQSLREPEGWRHARERAAEPQAMGSLRELLGDPRWRPRALLGLGLAAVGLGTYWGVFAWAPELAAQVLGPDASPSERQRASSYAYLLTNLTGTFLGLLAFAPLACWMGRRFAFAAYHVGALITVPLAYLTAQTYGQVLWLLPLMGFFVVGMHAGYAIYFPELFPTRLRATGASFCFNLGRLVSGLMLLVRGELRAVLGFRHAVVAMSALFLVGLILLAFAPETKGRELPE